MSSSYEVERLDEVEFKWLKKRGIGGKKKDVRFYESFTYDGVDYALYDCVYMYKEGEPEPYIGKLVKIWENADKSKKIKVQWFFRPSEIACYLKDAKVLENELFFASGEGIGLANLNPLEAIAGKCNVVCISGDARNPQPSAEERYMADYVFYRIFDVKTCTISDQMGDTIGGLEAKFVFNRGKSVSSLDVPKHDMSIKGELRTAIASKEIARLSGNHLRQEFNTLKPDEHGDYILAEEVTSVKQAQVKQELFSLTQVQVEERGKSARKSGAVDDDTISKRKKLDGAVSSSKAEDRNCVHGNVVVGSSNAKLKSEHVKYSVGLGKDVTLSENASSSEEKLLKETPRSGHSLDDVGRESDSKLTNDLMNVLAEKLSKTNTILCREKSESVQSKDSGSEKHKDLGESLSVCREMPSTANVVSLCETMRPLRTQASPSEILDFGGPQQNEKPVKSSSNTKKGQSKAVNGLSTEKSKPGLDACHVNVTIDKSFTKDSSPMEGFPRKKAKLDDSIQMVKDNEDTIKELQEKTCTSETKNLSPHVTPHNDKERSKVPKGAWNMKVGKLSHEKSPITTLEDDTKVGYETFEVTRRPLVEKGNWIKLPWEEKMKSAHDQGRLVLLQNLDPEYTSGDIEDIIWCAFKEHCTAKVVQHTAISNPHSGQVFVVFKTRDATDKVLRKLNDECLMLPNQRPLVACTGYFPKLFEKQMVFVGHLAIDKARRQIQREMKEAVSTSHYSQNNTIEYEMALAWCLLQSKSDKWWEKLYEQQRKELKKLMNDLKSNLKSKSK